MMHILSSFCTNVAPRPFTCDIMIASQPHFIIIRVLMVMMMKLPILPCAEKLELILSTAPRT